MFWLKLGSNWVCFAFHIYFKILVRSASFQQRAWNCSVLWSLFFYHWPRLDPCCLLNKDKPLCMRLLLCIANIFLCSVRYDLGHFNYTCTVTINLHLKCWLSIWFSQQRRVCETVEICGNPKAPVKSAWRRLDTVYREQPSTGITSNDKWTAEGEKPHLLWWTSTTHPSLTHWLSVPWPNCWMFISLLGVT